MRKLTVGIFLLLAVSSARSQSFQGHYGNSNPELGAIGGNIYDTANVPTQPYPSYAAGSSSQNQMDILNKLSGSYNPGARSPNMLAQTFSNHRGVGFVDAEGIHPQSKYMYPTTAMPFGDFKANVFAGPLTKTATTGPQISPAPSPILTNKFYQQLENLLAKFSLLMNNSNYSSGKQPQTQLSKQRSFTTTETPTTKMPEQIQSKQYSAEILLTKQMNGPQISSASHSEKPNQLPSTQAAEITGSYSSQNKPTLEQSQRKYSIISEHSQPLEHLPDLPSTKIQNTNKNSLGQNIADKTQSLLNKQKSSSSSSSSLSSSSSSSTTTTTTASLAAVSSLASSSTQIKDNYLSSNSVNKILYNLPYFGVNSSKTLHVDSKLLSNVSTTNSHQTYAEKKLSTGRYQVEPLIQQMIRNNYSGYSQDAELAPRVYRFILTVRMPAKSQNNSLKSQPNTNVISKTAESEILASSLNNAALKQTDYTSGKTASNQYKPNNSYIKKDAPSEIHLDKNNKLNVNQHSAGLTYKDQRSGRLSKFDEHLLKQGKTQSGYKSGVSSKQLQGSNSNKRSEQTLFHKNDMRVNASPRNSMQQERPKNSQGNKFGQSGSKQQIVMQQSGQQNFESMMSSASYLKQKHTSEKGTFNRYDSTKVKNSQKLPDSKSFGTRANTSNGDNYAIVSSNSMSNSGNSAKWLNYLTHLRKLVDIELKSVAKNTPETAFKHISGAVNEKYTERNAGYRDTIPKITTTEVPLVNSARSIDYSHGFTAESNKQNIQTWRNSGQNNLSVSGRSGSERIREGNAAIRKVGYNDIPLAKSGPTETFYGQTSQSGSSDKLSSPIATNVESVISKITNNLETSIAYEKTRQQSLVTQVPLKKTAGLNDLIQNTVQPNNQQNQNQRLADIMATLTAASPGGKCRMSPICGVDGTTYFSDCLLPPTVGKTCDGYCPCPEQPQAYNQGTEQVTLQNSTYQLQSIAQELTPSGADVTLSKPSQVVDTNGNITYQVVNTNGNITSQSEYTNGNITSQGVGTNGYSTSQGVGSNGQFTSQGVDTNGNITSQGVGADVHITSQVVGTNGYISSQGVGSNGQNTPNRVGTNGHITSQGVDVNGYQASQSGEVTGYQAPQVLDLNAWYQTSQGGGINGFHASQAFHANGQQSSQGVNLNGYQELQVGGTNWNQAPQGVSSYEVVAPLGVSITGNQSPQPLATNGYPPSQGGGIERNRGVSSNGIMPSQSVDITGYQASQTLSTNGNQASQNVNINAYQTPGGITTPSYQTSYGVNSNRYQPFQGSNTQGNQASQGLSPTGYQASQTFVPAGYQPSTFASANWYTGSQSVNINGYQTSHRVNTTGLNATRAVNQITLLSICLSKCVLPNDPVCSASGNTYDNACFLSCSGEVKLCNGTCPCEYELLPLQHRTAIMTRFGLQARTAGMDPMEMAEISYTRQRCSCALTDTNFVCTSMGSTLTRCFAQCKALPIRCRGRCPCK